MSLDAAKTESWAQGRIPVLDIRAYLAGEAGAAAPLARAMPAPAKTPDFSSSPAEFRERLAQSSESQTSWSFWLEE